LLWLRAGNPRSLFIRATPPKRGSTEAVKTIAAIPVAILKFLFTHKKVLLICIVGVIALIAYRSFTGSSPAQSTQQIQVPKYEQSVPDTLFIISTQSRLYYVNSFTVDTPAGPVNNMAVLPKDYSLITLTDFYYYDKDKWELGKTPLPLSPDIKLQLLKR
jgi:hypothetical protein